MISRTSWTREAVFFYSLLILLSLATALFAYLTIRPYLWSSFIALTFYISTRKIYKRLRASLPKYLVNRSPLIMTLSIISLILIPMFFVTSKILKESLNLVNTLRSGLNDDSLIPLLVKSSGFMSSITEKEFFWVGIPKLYYEFVGKYTDILNLDSIYSILRNSTSLLAGSFDIPFTILFNTLLFFLILYFLYKEGNHIENYLIRTLPFSKHLEQKIGLKLEEAIESVVLGNLFVSLLQGLFLYILLFLWGIPNSFLFATIATFFSLIPVVGTSVIWLPVMVYLGLFSSSWAFAIPFGILSFSGYLILENYIKPNFLDKKLNMHPFLIFLSLIGGINQFGVVGIVIGPVSLTFLLILLEFWRDFQNISSNE